MQHPSSTARVRKGTAFLPAFAFTFLLTATTPGIGSGEDGASIRGLVHEFNSICADLQTARCDLQMGTVDQTAFGDRILELFVRADSITTLLDRFAPAPRIQPWRGKSRRTRSTGTSITRSSSFAADLE